MSQRVLYPDDVQLLVEAAEHWINARYERSPVAIAEFASGWDKGSWRTVVNAYREALELPTVAQVDSYVIMEAVHVLKKKGGIK